VFAFAANAGLLAFLLVSLVVGARLLLLARRTRALPELCIGTGFFVGGALGFVPETLAVNGALPEVLTPGVLAVSNGAIRATAVLTALFTWRVFRPGRTGAALTGALSAVLLVAYVAFPAPWVLASTPAEWRWSLVTAIARSVAFAWAAGEPLAEWRRARRRAALGLAEPAAVQRLLLWGLAIAGVTGMSAVPLVYRLLPRSSSDAAWTLAQSALGLGAALAMTWTFLPHGRGGPARHEATHRSRPRT
jgi:hypothetical protein